MSQRCFHDIRETFLYCRNEARVQLICLCKVETTERWTGYGWAICSSTDQTCYANARFLAAGRARAALHRGTLLDTGMSAATVLVYARPIRRHEARVTMALCEAFGLRALADEGDWHGLPYRMQPEALRGQEFPLLRGETLCH